MAYRDWWTNLGIPWLTSGPVGEDEASAMGAWFDSQVGALMQATLARMPERAPPSALPAIADDRRLIRGPAETNEGFAYRLKKAWEQWEHVTTPLSMLVQLYYAGYDMAILVQQNGRSFRLTGTPNLVDLTLTPMTIAELAGNPTLPGSPAWWTFDDQWLLCRRFALLLPSQPSFWRHTAVATFTDENEKAITWSTPFLGGTSIQVMLGSPVTGSGPPPALWVDPSSVTNLGCTVKASDNWTGLVDVLAWQTGLHPLASPNADTLAILRELIRRWKRGKSTCHGIYALVQGDYYGYPYGIQAYDGGGGQVYGPSDVAFFAATG